jgi:hypothetical protein
MLDEAQLDQRFTTAPQAVLEHPAYRLTWPHGGFPVALGSGAATMLDCFEEPLAPRELATDLVAALGLDEEDALHSIGSFTDSLLRTGHLIPEGLIPMPADRLTYPPSASP